MSKKDIPPQVERKPDTSVNGSLPPEKLQAAKLREAGRIPLRINSRTSILVLPKNHNEKYAAKIRKKLNIK